MSTNYGFMFKQQTNLIFKYRLLNTDDYQPLDKDLGTCDSI